MYAGTAAIIPLRSIAAICGLFACSSMGSSPIGGSVSRDGRRLLLPPEDRSISGVFDSGASIERHFQADLPGPQHPNASCNALDKLRGAGISPSLFMFVPRQDACTVTMTRTDIANSPRLPPLGSLLAAYFPDCVGSTARLSRIADRNRNSPPVLRRQVSPESEGRFQFRHPLWHPPIAIGVSPCLTWASLPSIAVTPPSGKTAWRSTA